MPSALIVVDDRHGREGLARWVGAEGFEVRTAASLSEARRCLSDGAVDVAIIDLMLPDGSGLDLVHELDQQPNVEVLIVTGHGTVDSAVEALRGGAIDDRSPL